MQQNKWVLNKVGIKFRCYYNVIILALLQMTYHIILIIINLLTDKSGYLLFNLFAAVMKLIFTGCFFVLCLLINKFDEKTKSVILICFTSIDMILNVFYYIGTVFMAGMSLLFSLNVSFDKFFVIKICAFLVLIMFYIYFYFDIYKFKKTRQITRSMFICIGNIEKILNGDMSEEVNKKTIKNINQEKQLNKTNVDKEKKFNHDDDWKANEDYKNKSE
ncbi:hypothetical protein SGLAD_v1c05460 [Spiroplasma gladiatoris]|uniref:Transmembrane protein n=1 Tax=Spiroplasma gladiatoris TaxID=2143 RepID=A0A4P7AH44_9MOLU|nr:hypothetical protein [Spiroplasma gladiatoris]QBQ07745.1 hypothetical protein SGLAD_v1c05460 [Spiroplasma gladiatoris]